MAYAVEDEIILGLSDVNQNRPEAQPNHVGLLRAGELVVDSSVNGPVSFVDPEVDSFPFIGHRGRTFFDDLYFRVHFEPGEINLGNILSVRTEEVRIWNAHLSSKDMTDYLEPVSQGLTISAPVTAPYTLLALEELSYTVTVSTDGPPQFSEQITWTIDGIDYAVPVTGDRVVVWPFGPNWDQPVVESLEWKTDVLGSFDGTEQRRPLRSKPRRRFGYRLSLHGNQANQFQNLLFGWQDRQYAIPVWFDKTTLVTTVPVGAVSVPVDTTTRSFFAGGLAILMWDTYSFEVVEIDQVTSGVIGLKEPLKNEWGPNTRVYPLNLGTLPTNIPTRRISSKVLTGQIEFITNPVKTDPFIPGEPAVETLDGYEIIYRKPNWTTPVQYEMESGFDLLDFETGATQQVQNPDHPKQVRRVNWLLKNRQDIVDFRGLLGRRKGRYTAAYVPTWFSDFEISDINPNGSSILKVKRSQYDTLVGAADTQFALLIRMKDGTRFIRKIIGTSQTQPETEILSVDQPLPFEVNPDNTLMVSLVHLCRLVQDGVTINYQSDSVATVEMSMMTVRS